MTRIHHVFVFCLGAALTCRAPAATRYVNGTCGSNAWSGLSPVCAWPDGPKASIQVAINASSDGDEIVVADGTYPGGLSFGGRRIVLRSGGGPDVCRIDCQGISRGLFAVDGETTETVLEGFTITNGQESSAVRSTWITDRVSRSATAC